MRLPKLRPPRRRLRSAADEDDLDDAEPEYHSDYDAEVASIFTEEASELIDVSEQALHAWRAQPDSADLRSALKRPMHTLKGGARMAGVIPMGDLSHELETLVMQMDSGLVPTTDAAFEAAADLSRRARAHARCRRREPAGGPRHEAHPQDSLAVGAAEADAAKACGCRRAASLLPHLRWPSRLFLPHRRAVARGRGAVEAARSPAASRLLDAECAARQSTKPQFAPKCRRRHAWSKKSRLVARYDIELHRRRSCRAGRLRELMEAIADQPAYPSYLTGIIDPEVAREAISVDDASSHLSKCRATSSRPSRR